jgi:hypothetical protein
MILSASVCAPESLSTYYYSEPSSASSSPASLLLNTWYSGMRLSMLLFKIFKLLRAKSFSASSRCPMSQSLKAPPGDSLSEIPGPFYAMKASIS